MISVAESVSRKRRRNNIRSHSFRDLREHLERRARQAGENSAQILYLNEYQMEIQNLKRRNSECALIESQREPESQRRQLQETNQSKLNVREYISVAN